MEQVRIVCLINLYHQDYQFWIISDEMGYFNINNIRTGTYNLYTWVPGFIGDYRNESTITITAGLNSSCPPVISHL